MSHVTFAKPLKGTATLERRQRRADVTSHERREMDAAKRRDHGKCRVPRCEYAPKKLRIDACHQIHRGMGGNPAKDRTTRATVISLCVVHHGLYDRGELDIEPLTDQHFDGVCAFYAVDGQRREHYATERIIGVSEPRT